MAKEVVVRAVDVGRANTKFTARVSATGTVKCAMFPSMALPREAACEGDKETDWEKPDGAVVDIPVGDLLYTVGPDVHLAGASFDAQVLQHDGYTETPEYVALTLGALYYMDVDRVDLLVVGLPVATMRQSAAVQALQKRLRGTHKLANARSVHVARVEVLAQPAGALMYYGVTHRRLDTLVRQKSLVVDVGSRTFDWVVAEGMRQQPRRSDSVARGMFDVLDVIANGVSRNLKMDYRDYAAIDVALRSGTPLTVFQESYPVERHIALARKIPQQAVAEMLHRVGPAADINNLVLAGGGAFFFHDALRQAFPRHQVVLLKDPVFSVVNGLQIAGMQVAKQPVPAELGGAVPADGGDE